MIYIIIIFALLILLYQYDIRGYRWNRNLWYNVVLITFILTAGLRYRLGIDTPTYIYDYFHDTPTLSELEIKNLTLGDYPLWKILNSLGRSLNLKFFIIQLIESTFVNILIFRYIKKHSSYIFTCIFFYFIWMYASYNMEAMKAGFSMTICLYANDYILEKKWQKGIILFAIATLFHPSTLLIAAVSFLTFLKFDYKGIIFLLIVIFSATIIQNLYGDIISFLDFDEALSNKAEAYGNSERYFAFTGRNYNFFIFYYVPLVLSTLTAFFIIKKSKCNDNSMTLEPYLFLGILFYIISAIILIFFRIFYFYVIYVILFISQALITIIRNSKFYGGLSIIIILMILFPFLFYIKTTYQNERWMRYYPYSSIIEKNVNEKREMMYNFIRVRSVNPPPIEGEY